MLKKGNPLKGRSLNGTNRCKQERIILISHVPIRPGSNKIKTTEIRQNDSAIKIHYLFMYLVGIDKTFSRYNNFFGIFYPHFIIIYNTFNI